MRTSALSIMIAGALLAVAASASQPSLGNANQLAHAGKWIDAVAEYEAVLAAEGPTAAVLFNLGNAYHHAGDTGRAILAWERAKLAAPRDADIAHNLVVARREAGIVEAAPAAWMAPAFWLGVNEWTATGCGALAGIALLSLAGAFGVNIPGLGNGIRRGLWITAVSLLALSASAIILRSGESRRAIVTAPETALRISPFAEARESATLAAGTGLRVLRQHGDFMEVITGEGSRGWLQRDGTELVRPGVSALLVPPHQDCDRNRVL